MQYGGALPIRRGLAWLLQNQRSYNELFAPGKHHKRHRHKGYFSFPLDVDGDADDIPMATDLAYANPPKLREWLCSNTQFDSERLPELCSATGQFPSTQLDQVRNRISVVLPRELNIIEGKPMLLLHVGEMLWAYTMKTYLEETSDEIEAILLQLPSGQELEDIRNLALRLHDFNPIPSFNMEIMLYIDAANVWKKADALFGAGATEITTGFAFIVGWKDTSFGLLKVKALTGLFWSFPGTDSFASVWGHLISAGGLREIRRDFTFPIVAYKTGGEQAPKELWTTSVQITLDSKAAENLYRGGSCKGGPGGTGHGSLDLPARIWSPSDANCQVRQRDDSEKYVPSGRPICYWNWRLDICGKSRMLAMTLFYRNVCKVAITRVIGIEVMDIVWPQCYSLLQETSKRDREHSHHEQWKLETANACAKVIEMARPSQKYNVLTQQKAAPWGKKMYPAGVGMLQCPKGKLGDGGCKELKVTMSLGFYKVPPPGVNPAALAPDTGVDAATTTTPTDAEGGEEGGGDDANNGEEGDEEDDVTPHNPTYTIPNEDDADLSNTGYVFLRRATTARGGNCGYWIVLPSAEVAHQIDRHLKTYHNHNPVLQVPLNDRRAEALFTCLRGKEEYTKRVSDLETEVQSAPNETTEEKAAKRKLKRRLATMKRDGRGVGLHEMIELYDLDKDSDTCRYVMDDDNVLLNLIEGARNLRNYDLDLSNAAMDVNSAEFKTVRKQMKGLAPSSARNFIKKAADGIGKELFHNLRQPALLADLLFGDETFTERFRALVDGSMHALFRCPGTSYLGRAMVLQALMYDKKCRTVDQASRYSEFSTGVKNICKLQTGISLGQHKSSHHIKQLSGRGFFACMFTFDWTQHTQVDSKC